MSNPFTVQNALSLLISTIEIVLSLIFAVLNSVFFVLKLLLQYIFGVNMTESSNKRKRNNKEQPNQTIASRVFINANWQKLLSSNLMEKNTEKPIQDKKEHYTGAFRRARKKKVKEYEAVNNNMKTLNLAANATLVNREEIKKKLEVTSEVPKDESKKNSVTKFLAMDCEMVGIGYEGREHMLARVSIVNKFGDCIYDKFVRPREEVKDYRTEVSGVRKEDLLNGEDFIKVQKDVAELIKGRILVGHSLRNDLSVLFLSHPKRNIRDTSKYKPFKKITKGSTPSLKRLAKEILGIDIQSGEHSSVEDARAVMQLYCSVARQWEPSLVGKRGKRTVTADDSD